MARRSARSSHAKLRSALAGLEGLRLTIWRRAAGMLNLQFGPIRIIERGSIGSYGLHIDCPWRISRKGSILTGSSDLFKPKRETKAFDWQKWHDEARWQGNLMESIMGHLLKGYDPRTKSITNATRGFIVRGIEVSAHGDLRIDLSGGYRIDVFINGSRDEFYRLLDFERDKHHLLCK